MLIWITWKRYIFLKFTFWKFHQLISKNGKKSVWFQINRLKKQIHYYFNYISMYCLPFIFNDTYGWPLGWGQWHHVVVVMSQSFWTNLTTCLPLTEWFCQYQHVGLKNSPKNWHKYVLTRKMQRSKHSSKPNVIFETILRILC